MCVVLKELGVQSGIGRFWIVEEPNQHQHLVKNFINLAKLQNPTTQGLRWHCEIQTLAHWFYLEHEKQAVISHLDCHQGLITNIEILDMR